MVNSNFEVFIHINDTLFEQQIILHNMEFVVLNLKFEVFIHVEITSDELC